MWVERYGPKNIKDMVGNEETRISFLNWLKDWKKGSKPAILIGPPGTGKTTLVHLAADELGYNLIELNASDVRTKDKMTQKLGPTLSTHSLFNGKSLIFLDEVDGMYYRQDRGGIEFVQELIDSGRVPLVMAANIEDDKKVIKLIRKSKVFRFRRVVPRLVELYIEDILKKDVAKLSKESIRLIVREAKGDMRAAINTAQSLAGLSTEELSSVVSSRNLAYSLKESFEAFFNADSQEEAYKALIASKVPPRDKVKIAYLSVINSGLKGDTLIKALEKIGEADKIVNMIGTTQEWRLLRYLDRLLAYSLFNTLPKGSVSYSEEDMPWNLKVRMWNEGKVLKDIGGRLSKFLHISSREAVSIFMPYLLVVIGKDKKSLERFIRLLGLGESALKVMMKEAERVSLKVR
ncbi:MAG: AAA family ATPase [Candidatus Methylarchaceae archaeon HK02M1]|nr:AAA family ATPase [Candidatus Methylarchaceae archaeon HK02M1]